LDTSFNGEGSTVTSLVPGDDEALAVGRLGDGRLVAGGYTFNGTDRDFAVACYQSNGTLDYSFGDNGAVLTSIGNGHEEITALVIDPADRIVVVGSSEGTAGKILVAARYLPNGSLDRNFGEQGVSLIGLGHDANAEGLVLRNNGSLILSGSYTEKNRQVAMLVGLHADGSLDTGFGEHGIAAVSGPFSASEGYGATEDKDGMLYLAGAVGDAPNRDAALFRFTETGKQDLTYGQHGAVIVGPTPDDEVFYDVTVSAGMVTAGGFALRDRLRRMLLASLVLGEPPAGETASLFDDGDVFAPIQEVRMNGNTRVQIRKLQMWSSEMLIHRLELLESLLEKPTTRYVPPLPAITPSWRSLSGWKNYFLPAAWAVSPALDQTSKSMPGISATHLVTTAFGSEEAVCYALALDGDGQVVVVGTAEGRNESSIVAARLVADDVIDRLTDRPGHRSTHITTLQSSEVTQTTVMTGGEIRDSFPKKIVRRGVLFSLKPGQMYRGKSLGFQGGPSSTRLDQLADIFVPSAMAAPSRSSEKPSPQAHPSTVVEDGITDNGTGPGEFRVLLENLQPGSIYYIRAYVLTSSGEIYYGDQISVRTADACFVATASYGSVLHPYVQVLRDFRDFYLHSSLGRQVVRLYYTLSPPLADCIADSVVLRFLVRLMLLPIIGFAWTALHFGLPLTLLTGIVIAAIMGKRVAAWQRGS
jgi:uncharacterized delta-60 repeat protein